MKHILLITIFIMSLAFTTSAQKMTAEEVIKKHLDSVGTAEDRAKVQNIAIMGTVGFSLALDKNSKYFGKSAFAGEGLKRIYGLDFSKENNSDYPFERIINNEKDLKISLVRFGQRSALGDYLFRNQRIVKDGLFGGALLNNWAITDLANSKAKISFDGKKKVNGVDAYAISYEPKKGFSVAIKLFFDATTFQHIRTEYRSEIGAQIGASPEASAGMSETKETLIEDFSDFKTETFFTLPHKYKVVYSITGRNTKEFVYNFELKDFYFNANLGENPFESDKK